LVNAAVTQNCSQELLLMIEKAVKLIEQKHIYTKWANMLAKW